MLVLLKRNWHKKVAKEDEPLPRGIFRRGWIFWIRYADVTGKIRREPGGGAVEQAVGKLTVRRAMKLEGKTPKLQMDRIVEAKAQAEAAKLPAANSGLNSPESAAS